MGAPKWPPNPQPSERPGEPVALLDASGVCASEDAAGLADGALGEAREAKAGDVERRLAVDDELGDEPSGDRAHREAMTAEAGRQHEAVQAGRDAEDGHEIRRRIDVPRPAPRDPERGQAGQHALELGEAAP